MERTSFVTTRATALDARSDRRSFVTRMLAGAALAAGVSSQSSRTVSAGQVGYVATSGAPLMVHPTDHSVIDSMEAGTAVDILFGPYEGMYEVRYYGTDGWAWEADISLNGAVGGSTSAPTTSEAPAAAASGEAWIDVNRSTGAVQLMVGDTSQATFWGSMGYDTSANGYASTAVGTYFVYEFDQSLHYTDLGHVYITDWVGFDPSRFNGFHSYSKDASGNVLPNGGGNTAGCVALPPGESEALFDFAQMGMRVEVHF